MPEIDKDYEENVANPHKEDERRTRHTAKIAHQPSINARHANYQPRHNTRVRKRNTDQQYLKKNDNISLG